RQFAADNKSLGQFRLDGIPPARRGMPQIEVTFDIDANGIVNVSAKDLGTGKEQHITITGGSSMSDDEIDKAVKDAQQYEAEDKKRKEAIDTKNDADSFAFQTENALNEVGDKLDAAAKSEVEADLNALKEILSKHTDAASLSESDVDEIKAAKSKLETSAQKVFSAMYENMQQSQGAGPQPGPAPDMGNMGGGNSDSGSSSDDSGPDVVDADYREV
ncbi:MAG: Hsp70 family protein, partial [Lachnospiraceae bacterium]|nr:Hsp70 family protein [Lachnospiraceae bacterium]